MKTIKRLSYALALILTLSLLPSCTQPPGSEGPVEIGKAAPAFQLRGLDGGEVSLDQFKGKVVLLDFWATWCGPCRMSMPMLERLQKEFPNDLVLLAINLQESPEEVRDYIHRQNLQSRVLLDEEGRVGRAYQSESIPMQVLIDRNGIVRDVLVGFSPRIGERLRSQVGRLL